MQRRIAILFMVTLLAASACTSAPSPAGSDPSACTVAVLQPVVTAYVQRSDPANALPISDLQCAQGWAVAAGILGPDDPPADGPHGAPTSVVLAFEDGQWVVREKADVCGVYDPNVPDAYPDDAAIPEALYVSGCLAG